MIKPIKIIEVKSEIGAGTRGSSMGVDAIKIAALDFGSPFFKRFKTVEIPNENKLLLEPVVNDYAKRIKGIYALNERIAKEIQKSSLLIPVFAFLLLLLSASAASLNSRSSFSFLRLSSYSL